VGAARDRLALAFLPLDPRSPYPDLLIQEIQGLPTEPKDFTGPLGLVATIDATLPLVTALAHGAGS